MRYQRSVYHSAYHSSGSACHADVISLKRFIFSKKERKSITYSFFGMFNWFSDNREYCVPVELYKWSTVLNKSRENGVREMKAKPNKLSWRSEKLNCLTRNMAFVCVLSDSFQQPESSETCPKFFGYTTTANQMVVWNMCSNHHPRGRIMRCAFTDV